MQGWVHMCNDPTWAVTASGWIANVPFMFHVNGIAYEILNCLSSARRWGFVGKI